jgi:AcrR family transcriptional regulator
VPGLRERKQRAAREAMLAAASELFSRQGYDRTTLDEVAELAQVSRRTLFRYFPGKDDLVFDLENDVLAALAAGMARPLAPNGLTAARQAASAACALLEDRRDELLQRRSWVASSPALQLRDSAKQRRWEQTITDALVAAGHAHDGDAKIIAKVTVACIELAYEQWVRQSDTPLVDHLHDTFTALTSLVQDHDRVPLEP